MKLAMIWGRQGNTAASAPAPTTSGLWYLKGLLKAAVKTGLYRSGALAAYHRLRNRRALTVVMFHRVLPKTDGRWAYCDPEYTIEASVFERCLDFFQEHYNVIGVDRLLDRGTALPERPLLITFDDGWADHEQVALPLLARRSLPSLVFVAADAVDNPEPAPFWETRLIHAFRRGTLDAGALYDLWRAASPDPAPSLGDLRGLRALIAKLFSIDPDRIPALLAPLEDRLKTPDRHLLTGAELANLPRGGMAVGAHGACHRPLARIGEPAADMTRARSSLGQRLSTEIRTMSFPHGSYDAGTVSAARAAGYELIFTSDRALNEVPDQGERPTLLGRVGLFEDEITGHDGRFRPDLLALWLWRPPVVRLGGDARSAAAA
jgi:peptidoglycan/xylan/chitin deacetylase (PgdA/CDA1 family)